MTLFRNLHVWIDHEARPGPEAMAVDEWLLESTEIPVLRVYSWAGEWASLGYFGEVAAARAAFPGVDLVRRWTGGGMVDHRGDWTYSLIVPKTDPLANSRGATSYRSIHKCLVGVLADEGLSASLSEGAGETGDNLCFSNPVTHDIIGEAGAKLAGAGQRRTRLGLLHQGSVAVPCRTDDDSRRRTLALAEQFCPRAEITSFSPEITAMARKTATRYASAEWTGRR